MFATEKKKRKEKQRLDSRNSDKSVLVNKKELPFR